MGRLVNIAGGGNDAYGTLMVYGRPVIALSYFHVSNVHTQSSVWPNPLKACTRSITSHQSASEKLILCSLILSKVFAGITLVVTVAEKNSVFGCSDLEVIIVAVCGKNNYSKLQPD